jgi:hypothetical protein
MIADVAFQHTNWIIAFATAIAIPTVLIGSTLTMLWLNAKDERG